MSATNPSSPTLLALRRHLASTPPGPVACVSDLMDAWETLAGNDEGGMETRKLSGRCRSLTWQPPNLTFEIERHGAVVAGGSGYAEIQHWRVDVQAATAEIMHTRRRRIRPVQLAFPYEQVAAELADHILDGVEDGRLRWSGERVQVRAAEVLPPATQQTMKGRRRRLNAALEAHLGPHGWTRGAGGWRRPPNHSNVEGG